VCPLKTVLGDQAKTAHSPTDTETKKSDPSAK
jgi:hypothetical protein